MKRKHISENFKQTVTMASLCAKLARQEKDIDEKAGIIVDLRAQLAKAEQQTKLLDKERLKLR